MTPEERAAREQAYRLGCMDGSEAGCEDCVGLRSQLDRVTAERDALRTEPVVPRRWLELMRDAGILEEAMMTAGPRQKPALITPVEFERDAAIAERDRYWEMLEARGTWSAPGFFESVERERDAALAQVAQLREALERAVAYAQMNRSSFSRKLSHPPQNAPLVEVLWMLENALAAVERSETPEEKP